MRVLVTGSSGLIGRELMTLLKAARIEAVEYDLQTGRDICDPDQLSAALQACDGVIHLAAVSRVAWAEAAPQLCHHVNVDGTATLLDRVLAQPTPPWVVFASSREVYGDPAVVPVTEDAPMDPVNHYGRSKAQGERLFHTAQARGLRCAIVRLSNVYGTEHDHPDRAVPALLWRSMAGLELRLSGVDAFFDFVHVDDTANGLMMAALKLASGDGSVPTVHLATGIATSLGELAQAAIKVAQSTSALTILPARSFDVKGFCGHPAKAQQVLGWTPEIPLDQGLRRFHRLLKARNRPLDPVLMPTLLV